MFARHLEVMCILGIKIDSLVLSVMEEHKKYCPISTKFKPASEHNLDNFWSSGSFFFFFRIFAHILATSFSVAHHWLGLLQ